jgi:hypothetical protein
VPRVLHHPPDEMPDEGATTGTSHDVRLQARASASAANSYAPALDEERERRSRLLLLDEGRSPTRLLAAPFAAGLDDDEQSGCRTRHYRDP